MADPSTNQSQAVSAVPHTTYTIDAADLVSAATDPDGNNRSASYTPLGDTASSTNAAGGATTFSYPSGTNGGESLTQVSSPGGATESAAYTNTGAKAYLPSSSTDDAGSALTYTYDTNGNQASTAQGASGPQAKVTYNSDGTPATSQSPGAGATVKTTYAYGNSDGDLTTLTPPSTSSLGARAYTWDGFGRLKTATDGAGDTTTYTYGPLDWIGTVAYSDGTTSVIYTYDKNGHVTQRTDDSGTTTYSYDDLGHLLSTGNTTSGTTITTSPTRTASFNAAGQQTDAVVSGVHTTYTYAGTNNNEVVSEAIPNDHTYVLSYGRPDANGLPVIDSVAVNGIGTGYVLSDPSRQPVMLGTSSGVTCLYLYDGIHNPVGLSASTLQTSQAFRYDPYGGSTTTTSNGFSSSYQNPYAFGVGIRDRATGEVKFGKRFYSPTTSNWTQQDTLNAPLDPGNANRYEYAADNPVNDRGPSGQCDSLSSCAGGGLDLVGGSALALGSAVVAGTTCETVVTCGAAVAGVYTGGKLASAGLDEILN